MEHWGESICLEMFQERMQMLQWTSPKTTDPIWPFTSPSLDRARPPDAGLHRYPGPPVTHYLWLLAGQWDDNENYNWFLFSCGSFLHKFSLNLENDWSISQAGKIHTTYFQVIIEMYFSALLFELGCSSTVQNTWCDYFYLYTCWYPVDTDPSLGWVSKNIKWGESLCYVQ